MMKAILIGGAAVLMLGGTALAQDGARGGRMGDADGDGRVSRAEFTAAAMARFDAGDANHDGLVTRDEVRAAGEARREEFRSRMFTGMDGNGDGSVTPAEIDAAREARREEMRARAFARIDANGDGALSREEFDSLREHGQRGERGEGRRGGRHGWGGRGHGPRGGGFGGMPIEADGVTRAEAETRAAERFDRMDANDDGFLSAEDRPARRRGGRGGASE